jgi:hypothetical protein
MVLGAGGKSSDLVSRSRIRKSGEQEEDQVVWGEGGESCEAGGDSGNLESRRRIIWSRRRIRWSGEQGEDHVEQEEDHVEQGEDHVEQEEDQVVWRAGGGSGGLESRSRSR